MKMRVLKSEKTNDMNTTAIISIAPCAASVVLKSLHENKIACDYMGIDQSGRILMQICYEKSHDALVKEINTYMATCEEMFHAMIQTVNELIQKKYDEIEKSMEDIKKKYAESKEQK